MKKFMKKNGATILTGLGAVGLVATSVATATATVKAVDILNAAKEEKGEDLTKMEVVKATAVTYVPAMVFGAVTIACIIGSNTINKKTQTSIMGAYVLLDGAFKEFKAKVEETYGKEAVENIRSEIAKDHYEEAEVTATDGKKLYFDMFSGRYFEAQPELVVLAQMDVNRILHQDGCVDINEYYQTLGLPHDPAFDELGWSIGKLHDYYWESWIDFTHEPTEVGGGLECTIINIEQEPFLDYLDY